jgi:hypothetical protein
MNIIYFLKFISLFIPLADKSYENLPSRLVNSIYYPLVSDPLPSNIPMAFYFYSAFLAGIIAKRLNGLFDSFFKFIIEGLNSLAAFGREDDSKAHPNTSSKV